MKKLWVNKSFLHLPCLCIAWCCQEHVISPQGTIFSDSEYFGSYPSQSVKTWDDNAIN